MIPGLMLAGLLAAAPQTPAAAALEIALQRGVPAPDPNAPPVVDIALRMVRVGSGGSSIARSAARGDENAFLYAGLGSCVVGARGDDPALENSVTWRASGRVHSVERGIAVAEVEWQRLEYRPAGAVAGPRVRTTLTLPLGERVAVDFVDLSGSGSVCRMDALIFEIGVAPDHGTRLSMSAEGRAGAAAGGTGGGRGSGGGGMGRRLTPAEIEAQAERRRLAAEAGRAASVTRPMPPRQYDVDVWLVPDAPGASSPPALAQRLSQTIGGTGGRFAFSPISFETGDRSGLVEISALVIPVSGDRLIVAITRHVTPSDGAAPVSSGWIKSVPLPTAGDILSFEIPVPDASEAAIVPRQGYGLRVRIAHR